MTIQIKQETAEQCAARVKKYYAEQYRKAGVEPPEERASRIKYESALRLAKGRHARVLTALLPGLREIARRHPTKSNRDLIQRIVALQKKM